jgi:hypothetical protein
MCCSAEKFPPHPSAEYLQVGEDEVTVTPRRHAWKKPFRACHETILPDPRKEPEAVDL